MLALALNPKDSVKYHKPTRKFQPKECPRVFMQQNAYPDLSSKDDINFSSSSFNSKNVKSCPLCEKAARPYKHFHSKCTYLPSADRKYLAKARQIVNPILRRNTLTSSECTLHESSVNRVQIRQILYLDVFCSHQTVRLTLDSGATGNMIRYSQAVSLGIKIKATSQSAHQANGSSTLKVVGEIHTTFTRDGKDLFLMD
ncbi:hypothetical protein KUTeg_011180 [Tegillarca granosa]|uniref:Uncharacterized protein n=1 Tax=Tegillarca granosa TaxID=220873 RepID=A0ABQ9F1I5_TEGGR|nr:hypothetical protein KUTeg_011180 [Tegillarca granosa]